MVLRDVTFLNQHRKNTDLSLVEAALIGIKWMRIPGASAGILMEGWVERGPRKNIDQAAMCATHDLRGASYAQDHECLGMNGLTTPSVL